MFSHPNYYKKLRERNNLDQAISGKNSTEGKTRSPGLGLKQQAIEESVPHNDIEEASSSKRQASSTKLLEEGATSLKPQA